MAEQAYALFYFNTKFFTETGHIFDVLEMLLHVRDVRLQGVYCVLTNAWYSSQTFMIF